MRAVWQVGLETAFSDREAGAYEPDARPRAAPCWWVACRSSLDGARIGSSRGTDTRPRSRDTVPHRYLVLSVQHWGLGLTTWNPTCEVPPRYKMGKRAAGARTRHALWPWSLGWAQVGWARCGCKRDCASDSVLVPWAQRERKIGCIVHASSIGGGVEHFSE